MKNKLTVWILGGFAVGKTTQSRMLQKYLTQIAEAPLDPPKVWKKGKKDEKIELTIFSELHCSLGNLIGTECGGSDTLGSREQIRMAFDEAVKQGFKIITFDGMMATGTWIDIFKKYDDMKLLLIFLSMSPEANLERLKKRRSLKKNIPIEEIEFSEKTTKNMLLKLKSRIPLYERMKLRSDYFIKINVDEADEDAIFNIIKEKINKILFEI